MSFFITLQKFDMKSFAKFSIDSGWSWVVCVSSFIVQFAALGIPSSFGTFFVAFLQEFKEGESLTGKRLNCYCRKSGSIELLCHVP